MHAESLHRFPNEATSAGSTAYYVCLLSPKTIRDDLAALYLFRHELEKLYAISDPGVARMKLQWWHQQIQLPVDQPSVHPLARQLSLYYHQNTNTRLFDHLISAFDNRLHRLPLSDVDAYWQACINSGGAFGQLLNNLSNRILSDDKAKMYGAIIQHIVWLQNLGKLLRQRINLIPRENLEKHRLVLEQLILPEKKAQVSVLLHELQQQIEEHYNLSACQRGKTPLQKNFSISCRLLKLLKKEDFDVIQQRIALTPLSKLWFAR